MSEHKEEVQKARPGARVFFHPYAGWWVEDAAGSRLGGGNSEEEAWQNASTVLAPTLR